MVSSGRETLGCGFGVTLRPGWCSPLGSGYVNARHLAFDLNLPLSRSDLQRRTPRGVHPSSGGNLQLNVST